MRWEFVIDVRQEEAKQRAALLAEAGARLSESLGYEERLATLAHLCVRGLADWCVIDIVEGPKITRAAGVHANPEKQNLLEELRRRYPPDRDSPHPASTVLRTGQPILLSELSDDFLRSASVNEEHASMIRALGTRSVIIVSMVARGKTVGMLSLSSATKGRFGRADLELAEELARRAAIAIDNARLYRASQQAVLMREEFLSVASHELYTPMTALKLALLALQRTLLAPVDPARMSKLIALASQQGERLRKLVGDLLDTTRIEKGKLALELSQVDLEELVRDVVTRFELNLAGARCEVSIHGDGPIMGLWDRSRLDQVVTNLVSNAMKFGAASAAPLL